MKKTLMILAIGTLVVLSACTDDEINALASAMQQPGLGGGGQSGGMQLESAAACNQQSNFNQMGLNYANAGGNANNIAIAKNQIIKTNALCGN